MWSARQSRKMGRRVAGLLGGLLVGLLLAAAPAAAFVDPINLSNSAASSGRPAIAVNVNGAGQVQVFVVWEEGTDIFFTRTQGSCGRLEFEAPRILSAGTGPARRPAVAANDSRGVFVAWQASSAVWFSRSTDDGQNFSRAVNLSQSVGPARSPSVAADNLGLGGVFVAWSGGSSRAEIFLARSTDFGANFGPGAPANVSNTPSIDSMAPSVAAGGSNVFLAWEEGNFNPFAPFTPWASVQYRKIRLADLAVVASANLSPGLGIDPSPNAAFGDGVLSVVFASESLTARSVYHFLSDGINPSTPVNLSLSGPLQGPSNPRAARRNGSAMVAWAETLGGNTEIRYWLGTMTSPETVSPTPGPSRSPAAAIDSTGRLLVAWQETVNGNDEIYMSYRGGTSGVPATVWAAPRVLNYRTTGRGTGVQPNFTVFIQLADGSEVDPGSVKVNGQPALLAPSAFGDHNGDGTWDTMVKISRNVLRYSTEGVQLAAPAVPDGKYKVTGNTKGGRCFSSRVEQVELVN